MSHSTIFKVTLPDNTKDFELLTESDLEHSGFIDGYHEWVSKLDNERIEKEYNCLNGNMGIFKVEKGVEFYWLTLKFEDLKYAYLTNLKYARDLLTKHIQEIEEEKEGFADCYRINQALNGAKDDYYFFYNGSYYTKFEFIEMLVTGKPYFFKENDLISFRLEGAIDYHC